jgi:hypothetical protein
VFQKAVPTQDVTKAVSLSSLYYMYDIPLRHWCNVYCVNVADVIRLNINTLDDLNLLSTDRRICVSKIGITCMDTSAFIYHLTNA